MEQDAGCDVTHRVVFVISNPAQFRDAITRLRFLENMATDSTLGHERDALELAVSRYLALREQPATRDQNRQRI